MLAVVIACVLCASGVVVTERLTGRNLRTLVGHLLRPGSSEAPDAGSGAPVPAAATQGSRRRCGPQSLLLDCR